MRFEIVTLFPDYFALSLKQSLVGKAIASGLVEVSLVQLRDFATDKHRTVDDTPFGGGGGMVLKVEPLDACLKHLGWEHSNGAGRSSTEHLILTSAAGKPLTQQLAIQYSLAERITIICGHYLGVDERITELYEVEEISIGDYVLTGGEPAALVMVDAISRLIPKVLGNFESAIEDSYMNQLLGSPCYTKPAEYEGCTVPEVLQSGNHALIRQFRRNEAIRKCARYRPELLAEAELSDDEKQLVRSMGLLTA